MISSAYARPELLASTEWLAEQLAHPEVRILDVRWRPDGSARDIFSSGHIPGAVHLDWRRDLIADGGDGASSLLLAPPDQVAAALSAAGVGDGTTTVIYDDTLNLYAARTWWSLLAYGFGSARLLDGGWTAWLAEGRPVSNAVVPPAQVTFTPRANSRIRMTTVDVRGVLGSADTLILDARAPAEYRGL
ncbi:MAG: sulfurtransferase, partial [Chloroflexi bacterium]|nr:sulfurtransferase [Chloroflexota bacterium]